MKRVAVDTNVIASFLTDRNASQQAKAAALFEAAQGRHVEVVVPQIVLAELVYVLQDLYGVSREVTAATLRDLLALPGLETTDILPWTRVLELWPELVPDFADAALVAICEEARIEAIATFDAALRRRLPRLKLASYW